MISTPVLSMHIEKKYWNDKIASGIMEETEFYQKGEWWGNRQSGMTISAIEMTKEELNEIT